MDFKMNQPSISVDGPVTALYSQTTETNLFNDPSTGIFVNANPSLSYQFTGSLAASGTASIVAGFSTDAGFTVSATAGTTNTMTLNGFAGATLIPPTVTSSLQFASIDLSVAIIPSVTWELGIGCGSGYSSSICVVSGGQETGIGFSVIITTPFSATYNWQQTATSAATSTLLLTAQTNLVNIILDAEFDATPVPVPECTTTKIITNTYQVPVQACVTALSTPLQSSVMSIYSTSGAQSLQNGAVPVPVPAPVNSPTVAPGSPTFAPTASTGGGGTSSNSNDDSGSINKLTGGGIAGIVIATLVAVSLIGFVSVKFVLPYITGGKPTIGEVVKQDTTAANPMQSQSGVTSGNKNDSL